MKKLKGKHRRWCKRDFPNCPCLTCVHDNYNGGKKVEIEMCYPHEGNCGWTECEDYEAEE